MTQTRDGSCEVRQTAEQTIETCKTPDGTVIKKTVSGTTTTESKGNVMTIEGQCETLRTYLQEDVELMEEMKLGQGSPVINEFVSDPSEGNHEWVEIYNPSSEEISVNGWVLRDSSATATTTIAELTGTIPGGGFIIAEMDGKLANTGEVIYLKNGDGTTIDMVLYGVYSDGEIQAPGKGESAGRETDGEDTWKIFETPTPGATNE